MIAMTEVLFDPEHFFAEIVYESLFFVLGMGYVKYSLRRRDRRHNHDHEPNMVD